MKNQKGSTMVWVIVILVIVIVSGAAYWYWMQSSTQSAATSTIEVPTQAPITSVGSFSFNQGSLSTGSATPTITGSFSFNGTLPYSNIQIVISKNPLPTNINAGANHVTGVVWSDTSNKANGTIELGTDGSANSKTELFSDAVSSPLPPGSYFVGVYGETNTSDTMLLTSDTLVIK